MIHATFVCKVNVLSHKKYNMCEHLLASFICFILDEIASSVSQTMLKFDFSSRFESDEKVDLLSIRNTRNKMSFKFYDFS